MARTITKTPTGVEGGCGSHPGKMGPPGDEEQIKEITLLMLIKYASNNGWIESKLYDRETEQFLGDQEVVASISQFSSEYWKSLGKLIRIYAKKRGITPGQVIDEIGYLCQSL